MESDVSGLRSRIVLKTVGRMPRTFTNQLYAVDAAVAAWVSLGSLSYGACAYYLGRGSAVGQFDEAKIEDEVGKVAWTFQVQTATFGAVLLLNLLNLGMRQHLLPFKCNLLLLFINGVAFTTDLLLCWRHTALALTSSGRLFAPLRYVQWCHSTPSMIYMLALMAGCGGGQLLWSLAGDVTMVLAGLAACYHAGPAKWAYLALSFVGFGVVIGTVWAMFRKTLSSDVSPEQRGTLRTLLLLLCALWVTFPVVWLAADADLLGPLAEAVCWGVCDYLAKVVFSSQLWQSNLTGVQLRRDRALEAWEASNRAEAVARLTALLKQRDDLLSTLSHELRTPLAGIVALTEGLVKEVSSALPGSAAPHTLATVRATATCMLNIVTSTLDSFAPRLRGGGGAAAAVAAGVGGYALALSPPDTPDVVPGGRASGGGGSVEVAQLGVVDLRPLIETVTSVLRPLANDGVAVVNDLTRQLPLVCADATRLSQVLYNLVGNAMRFTSQGEVRVTARVVVPEGAEQQQQQQQQGTAAPEGVAGHKDAAAAEDNGGAAAPGTGGAAAGHSGGLWRYRRPRLSFSSASTSSTCSAPAGPLPAGTHVEVCVEDTGVGIPQDFLDELFLPYRTGHAVQGAGVGAAPGAVAPASSSSSSAFGGTGLGLYLVRLALRAQGSNITAESAPGLGSVFRFRLPVAPPDLVQAHRLQQQQEKQQRGRSESKQRKDRDAKHGGRQKDRTVQQPQQRPQHHRYPEGRLDDTAREPLRSSSEERGQEAHAGDNATASTVAAGAAASAATVSAGATGGATAERGASTSPPSTPAWPAPWVASAKGGAVTAAGIRAYDQGRGGSGGGGGAGGASGALLSSSALTSPRNLPHSKQLERLRRSLDDQRRLRLTAGSGASSPAAGGGSPDGRAAVAASAALARTPAAAVRRSLCSCCAGAMQVVRTAAGAPAAAPGTATGVVVAGGPTAAGAAASAPPARQNFRHRNSGTLQVMSVDDDPINQLVAGQMLASQSWKVVKCMNGPEALKHLHVPGSSPAREQPAGAASAPGGGGGGAAAAESAAALAAAVAAALPLLPSVLPDCVLLDVMMPGMSGFEVCRRLREHFSPAQLPIVIVSAKGDQAAVEEAFESGADDYMTKPYKRTEMVARIKAQIRIRDSALAAAAAAVVPTVLVAPTSPVQVGAGGGAAAGSLVSGAAASPAPSLSSQPAPGQGQASTASALSAQQATAPSPTASCVSAATPPINPNTTTASASSARGLLPQSSAETTAAAAAVAASPQGRPASADALRLGSVGPSCSSSTSEGGRDAGAGGRAPAGDGSRLRQVGPSREHKRSDSLQEPRGGGAEAGTEERSGCGALTDSVTALAVLNSAGGAARDAPPREAGSAAVGAAAAAGAACTAAAASGSGSALPSSEPSLAAPRAPVATAAARPDGGTSSQPATAGTAATGSAAAAATTNTTATAAAARGCGDTAGLCGPLQEVLAEVRRGRASEAEMARLHARAAALQTACSTLAAERDGWRRQARELRALLAAGLGGGAGGGGGGVVTPPLGPTPLPTTNGTTRALADGGVGSAAAAGVGYSGSCYSTQLAEALAAAHASRSSGDSAGGYTMLVGGCTPAAAAAAGLGGAGSGGVGNASSGSHVAAQLEDLKREAARLRQQLSFAMACAGGGTRTATASSTSGELTAPPGEGSGERGGLGLGACTLRARAGLVHAGVQPGGAGGLVPCDSQPLGGGGGGGGGGTGGSADAALAAAAAWDATTLLSNPGYAPGAPDGMMMMLTTQNSAMSVVSGGGGGGRGGLEEGSGLTSDGMRRHDGFVVAPPPSQHYTYVDAAASILSREAPPPAPQLLLPAVQEVCSMGLPLDMPSRVDQKDVPEGPAAVSAVVVPAESAPGVCGRASGAGSPAPVQQPLTAGSVSSVCEGCGNGPSAAAGCGPRRGDGDLPDPRSSGAATQESPAAELAARGGGTAGAPPGATTANGYGHSGSQIPLAAQHQHQPQQSVTSAPVSGVHSPPPPPSSSALAAAGPPPARGGSRSRGAGSSSGPGPGPAGSGILRMLCGKGALQAAGASGGMD